jgi:hypothetical protein
MSNPSQSTPASAPASSFGIQDLKEQNIKFRSKKETIEIAPSMAELRQRVETVRTRIESGALTIEDKVETEEWLNFIETETVELDVETRAVLASLKLSIEKSKMTPEQVSAKIQKEFLENASDPQKFDQFITEYLKKRNTYTPEYRQYEEFKNMWEMLIVKQGYTVKVIQWAQLVISDKSGVLDSVRTASINRIPDIVQLYTKQMIYLRSFHDTTSRSAKERAQMIVTGYNQQSRANRKISPLPILTDGVLADAGARNLYINDITNSGLAEPDKAIIISYLRNPQEAESIFAQTNAAARTQKQNEVQWRQMVDQITTEHKLEKFTEDDFRNPERFVSKLMSNMWVFIVPTTLYLILNLFGVWHDSLFMKVLAGATVLGVAKGTGGLDFMVDAATGKSRSVNSAIKWAKDMINTSSEDGFLKWLKDIGGGAVSFSKETVARLRSWAGYSNYQAAIEIDGKEKILPVMNLPFGYVLWHIEAGTFDARMADGKTMKSNGSDYADFVALMKNINLEGIKNYGEKRWAEICANRTVVEVIDVAHTTTGVPLSDKLNQAGDAAKSAAATAAGASVWVAQNIPASARDAANATKNAAGKAVDAAKEVGTAVVDAGNTVIDWTTGRRDQEISGVKFDNIPRNLEIKVKSEGNKITLSLSPAIKQKQGDKAEEVKEIIIADKSQDQNIDGYSAGKIQFSIVTRGGVVIFLDNKEFTKLKEKEAEEARIKNEKNEAEKQLKAKHDVRFVGTSATSIIEQIKAYSAQAKTNKQKEIATVDEYKNLLWEVLKSSTQVTVWQISDYIFDRTSIVPPIGITLKDTMSQTMFKRLLIVYTLGDNTSIKKEDFLKANDPSQTLEKYITSQK